MYCSSCGTKLNDDAIFCTNCGKKTGRGNGESGSDEQLHNNDHLYNQPIGKVIFHIVKESACAVLIVSPYFAILLFLLLTSIFNLFLKAFLRWLSLLPIATGLSCFVFVTAFAEEWYYYFRRQTERGFNIFSLLRIVGIVVAVVLSIRSCATPLS